MQILNSPKFKAEHQQILEFIDKTEDVDKKTELKKLFQQLLMYVKKIDQSHADLIISRRLSDDLNEPKEKILEIRKKIFRIISN